MAAPIYAPFCHVSQINDTWINKLLGAVIFMEYQCKSMHLIVHGDPLLQDKSPRVKVVHQEEFIGYDYGTSLYTASFHFQCCHRDHNFITVTPYQHHGVPNHWQFNNSMQEISELYITDPLLWESTTNAESVSMSWSHILSITIEPIAPTIFITIINSRMAGDHISICNSTIKEKHAEL